MQRLPEGYSALNHRLEHPAPDQHAEGDEIVHARAKVLGNVNPLVPGSNPGGPTIATKQTALGGIVEYPCFSGFSRISIELGARATSRVSAKYSPNSLSFSVALDFTKAESKRSLSDSPAYQRFTLGFGRAVFCDDCLSGRMPTTHCRTSFRLKVRA